MTDAMPFDLVNAPRRSRYLISLLSCLLILFARFPVYGQGDAANSDPGQAGSSAPDSSKSPDKLRFAVGWVSTGGSYLYVPEKWGELRINLVNSREEPRELMCATFFEDRPNLQYARQVWVPGKSTIRISHPVVIPPCDPKKGRTLNLQSLVIDATEGSDVLVKGNSGQLLHDGALLVTLTNRNTGIIGSRSGSDKTSPPEEVFELVMGSRVSQQLVNKYLLLTDPFLPADESEWNSFDQIVVTDNRIVDDAAALSALRHWVHVGGRLWVMLDHVDQIVLEKLLGDDFKGEVIDRVGLTTVRVDKAPSLSDPAGMIGESVDYEEPVEFVRMVASGFEVNCLVNDWPAAMTKPYGDGRILVTTLGARGWMTRRSPDEKQPDDPLNTSRYIPTAPMKNLAGEFYAQREPELVAQPSIEPQVREYIGYKIPSWGMIVGLLIGFSGLLVATAFGLLKCGRIESLGWIGSLMAIAASIGLLSIGRSYRHGIPSSVSSIQVARSIEGTDDVQTQGVVAAYHPDGSQSAIKVSGGGRVMPDLTGLENAPRRMVTTDLGKWHWENLPQPAGLRSMAYTRGETIPDRIEARATFDNNGLVGTFTGQLPMGTDALVATRNGRLGVTLKGNGSFVGRADDVFEKDQFLSSGFVSNEQERRRRTLEKLLTNPKRRDYPNRPQLLFWADQTERGIQFGEDMKAEGTTLVAVPLVFDRPANGTEFVIPSPFLPYRNQVGPDGVPSAALWNYGRNEWQDRSTPGTAWLNFHIPDELLPLTASRARIDLKVSGPIGRLEVLGLKNGEKTSLQTIMDPVGSLTIEIDDADVLSVADNGGVVIGISGGDPDRPQLTHSISQPSAKDGASRKPDQNTKVNYWRIEALTMQLWVKSTEPNVKD